jgi:hypothetical protein
MMIIFQPVPVTEFYLLWMRVEYYLEALCASSKKRKVKYAQLARMHDTLLPLVDEKNTYNCKKEVK